MLDLGIQQRTSQTQSLPTWSLWSGGGSDYKCVWQKQKAPQVLLLLYNVDNTGAHTGFIQFFQNIYLSIHYMQDTLLGAGETLVNQADIVPAFWSLTVLRLMYLTPAGNLLCSPYFSLPILKMEQQQKADLLLLSGGEALQGASRELFQACSEPRDHWAWET